MSEAPTIDRPEATVAEAEHVDVLIVGAGISGVSAGYHLQHSMPGTSFVMLEAQKSYGGTRPLNVAVAALEVTCWSVQVSVSVSVVPSPRAN